MPIKLTKGRRPEPSLIELHHTTDSVLHDMFEAWRESISNGVKMNLSIKEDHTIVLLWRGICARYHLLKEVEEKTKLLQKLKKELHVNDSEMLEALPNCISLNFLVLSEQEVKPDVPNKKPVNEEHFQPESSQEEEKVVLIPCSSTFFPLESLVSPIDSSVEGENDISSPSNENNQKDFESGLHVSEHQEHTINSSDAIMEDFSFSQESIGMNL